MLPPFLTWASTGCLLRWLLLWNGCAPFSGTVGARRCDTQSVSWLLDGECVVLGGDDGTVVVHLPPLCPVDIFSLPFDWWNKDESCCRGDDEHCRLTEGKGGVCSSPWWLRCGMTEPGRLKRQQMHRKSSACGEWERRSVCCCGRSYSLSCSCAN